MKDIWLIGYLLHLFSVVSFSAVAFSALTLLIGHQGEHPACKKVSGEVLVWLPVWNEAQMIWRL